MADGGPGVPPEDGARIFEPGEIAKSESRPRHSIGRGLAIARRLAERMGGARTYRRGNELSIFELRLLRLASIPAS